MKIAFLQIILFVIVLSYSCSSPLVLSKGTYREMHINSNKTIDIHMLYKVKKDYTELKFDSIKTDLGVITNFHLSVLGKSNTETKFNKGDTIIIKYNFSTIEDKYIRPQTIEIYYNVRNNKSRIYSEKLLKFSKLSQVNMQY